MEDESSYYEGAQREWDSTPPPLSPEEAEERKRKRKEEEEHFMAAYNDQSDAKCLRCTTRKATVAAIHKGRSKLPSYHFILCRQCDRGMGPWGLYRGQCLLCRKQFSFTKALRDRTEDAALTTPEKVNPTPITPQ